VPRKRAQHDNCFSARGTTKILLLLAARRGADGINLAEKIERVIALSHMHTHTYTYAGVSRHLSNPDELKSGGGIS